MEVTTFAMKPIIVKTNWILCNKMTHSESSLSDVIEWEIGRLLLSFVKLSLATVKVSPNMFIFRHERFVVCLRRSATPYMRRWVRSSLKRCMTQFVDTLRLFCNFLHRISPEAESQTDIMKRSWNLLMSLNFKGFLGFTQKWTFQIVYREVRPFITKLRIDS